MSYTTLKRALGFLLLLSLVACTINPGFNQLDLLKRWAKYKTKAEIEAQLWTARIGDYEQLAIPVQHGDVMTFYLKDGTEIDFSGWDIIALRNWNYYGKAIEVYRAGTLLEHRLVDGESISVECTSYQPPVDQNTQNEAGLVLVDENLRVADCRSVAGSAPWEYNNEVVLDRAGGAIRMRHHLAPKMPPLELDLNGFLPVGEH